VACHWRLEADGGRFLTGVFVGSGWLCGFSCCDRAFSAGVSLCLGVLGIFTTGRMVGHGASEGTHSIGHFHLFTASFIRKTTAFLE
jgi:hypothetical protein